MTAPRFMDNPDYVEYVRLLRELHRLIAEGKGDTEQADALRDDMDAPWHALSKEEIDRMNGLAADLYTLDEQPASVESQSSIAVEPVRTALVRAREAQDWSAALALLRQHPQVLPPHEAAFWRGTCWNQLGDADTAALFFQHAAELEPQNVRYPVAVLEAHLRAGHVEEALRYARTILERVA